MEWTAPFWIYKNICMKMKVGWAFELQFSELDRDHKLLIYCTVERETTDPWVPT